MILAEAAVKLIDMNGEEYSQHKNLNQLKKYYA